MRKPIAPKPLPTCTLKPPPVPTVFWTEEDWDRWVAGCCHCYGHLMWRQLHGWPIR